MQPTPKPSKHPTKPPQHKPTPYPTKEVSLNAAEKLPRCLKPVEVDVGAQVGVSHTSLLAFIDTAYSISNL
jgi:hypothetical protein